MYIIMLGGPGSGKGSVGGRVSEDFNLPHIATGDIFRAELKSETELGKKIKKYMDNGLLVPDEVVIETVESRLSQEDVKNGAILDGFPRTKDQAIALDKFLAEKGKKVDAAIELDVSDEDIVKRIVKRVICSNKSCGESYNTEFKPSKEEGICDKCGSTLIKRADDNEETVMQRLKVYHDTSKELLEYYKDTGVLYTVHPNIYSKTVLEDSVSEVETYLKNK
ncbi:MAG: adenylate kinase [Clostridia bacterium]|nr:adenylate kinase [Clostridia bacterium]